MKKTSLPVVVCRSKTPLSSLKWACQLWHSPVKWHTFVQSKSAPNHSPLSQQKMAWLLFPIGSLDSVTNVFRGWGGVGWGGEGRLALSFFKEKLSAKRERMRNDFKDRISDCSFRAKVSVLARCQQWQSNAIVREEKFKCSWDALSGSKSRTWVYTGYLLFSSFRLLRSVEVWTLHQATRKRCWSTTSLVVRQCPLRATL